MAVGSRVAGIAVVVPSAEHLGVDFLPWYSPRFYWNAVYNNFGGVREPEKGH
jgi:hypothetical protein